MPHQLSLISAVLININIMLGTGLFINISELAKRAGALGALSYLIIGVLLLPLILSITRLLIIYPGGSFYTFGAQAIHPFAGFFSAWSYFTGKLASAILAIHISVLLIQQIFPRLFPGNPLMYDIIILSVFIGLNMFNIRTGSMIQNFFLSVKIIPIIFVILCGLFFFNGSNVSVGHQLWAGIPSTLPLVLFATVGFEAACSLSSKIKNAKRNAPLAILISYAIVIITACLYQFLFYGVLGHELGMLQSFKEGLPLFLQKILFNQQLSQTTIIILNLGIASSVLGASYGILFSNVWNLYAIAEHKQIVFPSWLAQFNKHYIPWLCVLIEGVICLLYLGVTQGSQIPLQQITALGCIIAYTISVLALVYAEEKSVFNSVITILGLINCAVLIIACIYGFLLQGAMSLIIFSLLLVLGIMLYLINKQRTIS